MSEWNIINSTGSVVATAKKVEYHGKLMEERYVTVDLDSPVRLDLKAGYYMLYRGDKFTLRDSGEIEKSARPQSYGGAFTYKGLKLVAQSWQELQDTEMTDYVYGPDNKMHYTGLGTFQFYVTKVSDMGYRVQAVLDNKYGVGKWVVKIGGNAITGSYSDVGVDDAKYISISSGTSVKESLDMLWTEWGYYYKVTSGMVGGELVHYVDICPNAGTALPLYYGKKRTQVVSGQTREVGGLVKIVRKINPNVEICTRLRAYGSERNLPYHWYNNKYGSINAAMYIPQLMLPHTVAYYDEDGNYCDAEGNLYEQGDEGVVGSVNPWQYPNDVVLENVVASALFGKRDKEVHWNSDDMGEIFPSMKGMKASDVTGLQTKTFRNQGALDRILSFDYESSSDTGSSSPIDVTSDKVNFIVYVPNPGFNPTDHNTSDNVELLVQSGMCQARAFTIIKSEGCDSNGDPVTDDTGTVVQYKLTCAKVIDEEIDQVFPNSPYFEIVAGDYYVYTGLEFNGDYSQDTWLDVYVQAAEMRLLRAAALWLREHSSEDYIHEVSIDNVYMKTVPNISANLVEGAKVKIEDAQIGAYKTDIVESVTITEGKEAIPTYEITFLRRDESESLGDRVKGLVGQSISASSEIAKANDNLAKKVNKTGFHTLFDPLDAQYNVLDINGDLSNLKYIRANVDFFSIKGVAALGTTSGGGGGGGGGADLNALLDNINSSSIGDIAPGASEVGKCLVYNGNNTWTWATPGGGGGGTGTVTSVTAGTGLVTNPSVGITSTGSISIANNYLTRIDEGHQAYGWGNHANQGYLKLYSDGVVEGGQYYDFHMQNTSSDFSTRIQASGNYGNTLTLPSADGTLALVSQIPTSMPWSAITNKPTTISGYGISDAYISTINGVTSVTLGDKTFTPVVTYNNNATLTSPYYVVTSGSLSGNTLTLGRRTLASILNASGYSWWGQTMNSSGVVKGGLQYAEYIEFNNTSGAGHGGHLDFHFNGSSADYTSRIIESSIGKLSINSVYMSNGNAVIGDSTSDTTHYIQIGGGRIYWNQDNNSLYVQNANGTPCNFYSLGGIAALGATSGSGGLTELTLGKLNVTGEGVLFPEDDYTSKIYSSDGHLYFECDRDFVMSSDLYLDGCNLTALQVSAGTASILSNYVYINKLCRIYASGSTVYLQTRPNTTTTTWTTKETWS